MTLRDRIAALSARQKLFLLTFPLALGGYFYWTLLLGPLLQERARLKGELIRLRTELREKKRIAAKKAVLERELKALKARLALVMAKLPEREEIPRLLSELNTLGLQTGLEFLRFKPGKVIGREFYDEIPIAIKVEGGYHALGLFFEKVGRMERIVTISNLRIVPVPEKKRVVAEFRVSTYTYTGSRNGEGRR